MTTWIVANVNAGVAVERLAGMELVLRVHHGPWAAGTRGQDASAAHCHDY